MENQEVKTLTPIEAARQDLTKMKNEFAAALPPQIPAEKFVRTTITAVQMNPKLLSCDRRSLFASCMKSAQDGLLPDGREAALVIYGQTVQYLPMVAGLYKKMRNSGEISSISANVVYKNDSFSYLLGDDEKINHKPCIDGDRGEFRAVYAIAKTKDGGIYREVMTKEEVDKVRSVSKAKNAGPWVDWYDEMARKTVIRRIAKRLPSSTDLEKLLEHDNEAIGFERTPSDSFEQKVSEEPTDLLNKLGCKTGKEMYGDKLNDEPKPAEEQKTSVDAKTKKTKDNDEDNPF